MTEDTSRPCADCERLARERDEVQARAEHAEAIAAARLEALRDHQWRIVDQGGDPIEVTCSACDRDEEIGHSDDCQISAALRDDCGAALLAERDALRAEVARLRDLVSDLEVKS